MKKFLVAFVLAAGMGMIAYASLSNNSNKQKVDKKIDKTEKKKECKRTCMFS